MSILKFFSMLVATIAILIMFTPKAQAQLACDSRASIIEQLGNNYGEVHRGGGLTNSTEIYEIWASEVTGSWTILKTTTDGMSCVMAVGDNWQYRIPGLDS